MLSFVAVAQVPPLLMPNPLGMIITLGQWVYRNSEKVYYIEVAGQGATPEEARLNGFRLAVEQAVGSLIASETELNNARITRDEIISYASGYVDQYDIVKSVTITGGYQMDMKVWIKRSSLSNRLLNTTATVGTIDGSKAAIQLQTLQYERAQGDRILQVVLNDFFRRAFDIKLNPTQVVLNDYRQAVIVVPARISWNRDYLDSLFDAVKLTSQNLNNNPSHIAISTGGFMGGKTGTFGFTDNTKTLAIYQTMIASRPSVELTVKTNQNQIMHRQCFNWSELDHMDNYAVRPGHFVQGGTTAIDINGNFYMDIVMPLTTSPAQLDQAQKIEVKIVPKSACIS